MKDDKEMKKIIINGRFLLHRVTGVERYAREILFELDKLVGKNEVILAAPPEVEDIPDYKNIEVVRVGKLKNILWEHVSFPRFVKRQQGIALNLCNTAPLSNPGIVTIHDMKIKAYPEFFSRKFRLWYEILFKNETARAEKIITVSEFSKYEIMKYYQVDESRIVVIPCGWQHYARIGYDDSTLTKYGLEKGQYYFAMGSMDPNKNFKWIAETAKHETDSVFVVAGSINEKVFAEGMGFDCPPNMRLLGYVTDEEAKTLMRDSKAFLFPSFYEGFGIPPLEAVSAGVKSLVVSDIPVMHEIFGENINYINPYKDEKIDIRYSTSSDILDKYSWGSSAKALYEILLN